jgi:hypothetical protein
LVLFKFKLRFHAENAASRANFSTLSTWLGGGGVRGEVDW